MKERSTGRQYMATRLPAPKAFRGLGHGGLSSAFSLRARPSRTSPKDAARVAALKASRHDGPGAARTGSYDMRQCAEGECRQSATTRLYSRTPRSATGVSCSSVTAPIACDVARRAGRMAIAPVLKTGVAKATWGFESLALRLNHPGGTRMSSSVRTSRKSVRRDARLCWRRKRTCWSGSSKSKSSPVT